ncbi:U6 snRNA-associated Sm-like protein LSm6 [Wallemia mellicola CBS 633.66]|uniref:Sm domain-containing protein n=2 Tax=Wallemia mellicola TaxID=1708541 RepID=A0A4T0NSV0_9BASI|nr:U6 snRNA-associated Sm-like protein LSm6 [Wallemia mellicola CBS 633.66]TIB71071.1 hypothetical protein E3Q24_02546 [Wallemia mellicola]EIM22115.1 U6 snRNA-associated Sm-like protein LSm6 [Wallemia mellicola CBS 633.66]TIB79191.1 hypothetical protein E3Q23_00284 [Wallemia mellicola]TIB87377.1 hypothetical protein E3Q21_01297 [Wallemia mellicola]TIB90299.1 hypothetical protein E3Q20_01284 [Wallemia mellicola]|eukprot:XP_006957917.1 U6 snRNA-associated Sm-like protein LSm6 [Wallemia mellicola CBS 633.66]
MSSVVQSDTKGSPSAFLKAIVGKSVVVKLNSGLLYTGILQCLDGYMNLVITDVRESSGIAGSPITSTYGEAFIRGNNVLYISAAEAL